MLHHAMNMRSSKSKKSGFLAWEAVENEQFLVDLIVSEEEIIISFGGKTHDEIIIQTEAIDMSNHSKIKFNVSHHDAWRGEWSGFYHNDVIYDIPEQYRRKQPLLFFLNTGMGPEGYISGVSIGFTNTYSYGRMSLGSIGVMGNDTLTIKCLKNYCTLIK